MDRQVCGFGVQHCMCDSTQKQCARSDGTATAIVRKELIPLFLCLEMKQRNASCNGSDLSHFVFPVTSTNMLVSASFPRLLQSPFPYEVAPKLLGAHRAPARGRGFVVPGEQCPAADRCYSLGTHHDTATSDPSPSCASMCTLRIAQHAP